MSREHVITLDLGRQSVQRERYPLPSAAPRDSLAPSMLLSLIFVAGTFELRGLGPAVFAPGGCWWKPRAAPHRAPVSARADRVRAWEGTHVYR